MYKRIDCALTHPTQTKTSANTYLPFKGEDLGIPCLDKASAMELTDLDLGA